MRSPYYYIFAVAFCAVAGVLKFNFNSSPSGKCIQIFHDSKKEARGVQKYLRGFPEYSQYVKDIADYQRGDMEKCQVNFYVGAKDETYVPREFREDYLRTSTSVAWLGNNIWQLGDQLERVFGLRFLGVGFIKSNLPSEVYYKGQSFKTRSLERRRIELLPVNSEKFEILAEIRSDSSREILPYAVRSKNRYYFAGTPADLAAYSEYAPIFNDILAEMTGVPPHDRARSVSGLTH